jgi:hypothetical protein
MSEIVSISRLTCRVDSSDSVVYHLSSGSHVVFTAPFKDDSEYYSEEVLTNIEEDAVDYVAIDDERYSEVLLYSNSRTIWSKKSLFH